MKSKICCFAGHKDCYCDSVRQRVEETAEIMIKKENVREFWVGNYGGFDRISAGVVCKLKGKYPNIKVNLIIPYITHSINDIKHNFDNIIVADIPQSTPMKYRIIKTNEYMINNSDFLVCYVKYPWGGAARTLEYASRKKHIQVLNLFELQ